MTDAELLKLLEEKTPEELTLEEIGHLRQRLADSAPLREALLGQLQMETYLSAALGRVALSPQEIIARAEQRQSGWSPLIVVVLLLICLPVIGLTAAVVIQAARNGDDAEFAAQADPLGNSADQKTDAAPPDAPETDPSAVAAKSDSTPHAAADAAPSQKTPADTTKPEPSEVVPPQPSTIAPPAHPWDQVLAQAGPLPAYDDVAFDRFDLEKSRPRQADVAQWFAAVVGHNFRLHELDTRQGRCGAIEGMARLLAPWTEDSVLRLALEHYNDLQIHCFHGERGVTLVYHEDLGNRWVAYATTRKAGGLKPDTLAITASDDDRCRRTEIRFGGPIELRWRKGELILSRGDIVLLAAPLDGLPDDVFFEGRAAFQGIALARTSSDPPRHEDRPVSLVIDHPAKLTWQRVQPEGPEIEQQADGGVRLATAEALKTQVDYFAPLPKRGLHEIVVQLDEVTPGSSVYLADDDGKPIQVLRFLRNRKDGRLIARLQGVTPEHQTDVPAIDKRPQPVVAATCWVKLLHGCGNLRWWLSADGEHWAQVAPAQDNVRQGAATLGLQLVAKRADTGITLRRIELRELTGLTSLAEAELVERALPEPPTASFDTWLAKVQVERPADVDPAAWQWACALKTLSQTPDRAFAYHLLEGMLDQAEFARLPVERQLAALEDALLLSLELRDGPAMRVGVPQRIVQAGLRAYAEQGLSPWTTVRRLLMSAPIVSPLQSPVDAERLIRWELIDSVQRKSPQETVGLCRKLRFFELQQKSPLVDWAEAIAVRESTERIRSSAVAMKDAWRHPLVEEISKETYNALNEMQAVVDGEAWEDAARLLTSLEPQSASGLAPYAGDRQLLVSAPIAAQLLLRDYPQLREALSDHFAPLARLRLNQAMARGDWPSVELAAVQFAGTGEAAEAHRWLGDRALANGWFERALVEFEQAAALQPALAREMMPRMRLAAALLGREVGAKVTQPVQFGETSLDAAQFEALVAEMRGRASVDLRPAENGHRWNETSTIPPPATFKAETRSRLDGHVGDKPAEEVGRRTNQFRVPWPDRQTAVVVEENTMYVSNRFQVAAYSLADGKRQWRTEPPASPAQRSQEWACIAMRPLVTSRRIYTRMLYTSNPLLVSIEKQGGRTIWTSQLGDREFFVSDPIIVRGQLGLLSIALQESQEGLLRWNLVDAETGELQSQHDLIRLRNTWGARGCCQVACWNDSLIAVLGGVTLRFEPTGELRWVRKEVTIPAEEEPRWILQTYQPPLVDGDRVYITQPGVRAIECLDLATGTRRWQVISPEVIGLVGRSQDRLIVRTEQGLEAIHRDDGRSLWRRAASDLHCCQLATDETVLYAAREPVAGKPNQWQTRFVWLDAASGEERGSSVVPQFTHDDPKLGPLVARQDRLWTFFGRGQHDPNRDVVELVPTGPAETK